ncbi:universal stress protein A [Aureimonas sp. SA4125]|uniref:universal stress protein n=1 Tax=Aureimonas sp. SA4125 TaxID=2826993 RepID=UPI001CC771F0|nr:universal stress protein [Aureimonas sp. SA4125]BDA84155.1 universal stress protein A [Aureimonas sp. SA4125]
MNGAAEARPTGEETRAPTGAARHPAPAERSFRDLLVHLDGSPRDAPVIALADMLGVMGNAHVAGLLTNEIPLVGLGGGAISDGIPDVWIREEHELDRIERQARAAIEAMQASADLRRVDGSRRELLSVAIPLARVADLFVMAMPYGDSAFLPEMFETILFDAGVPVLAVPPSPPAPRALETIVVGWRDTRESAHAVAAALPLLQRARRVYLTIVADTAGEDLNGAPATDMARHLDRHGVSVEIRHLPKQARPADALMEEGANVGAGLLVVGGYSRSRLRERLLGGVTLDLLQKCRIPLLMAH